MIKELIIGFFGGIAASLIPGVHANTVAEVFLNVFQNDFSLALIIAVVLSTFSIFQIIPAILFSIPDSSLSILPGHSLTLEGKGAYAVKIALFSMVFSIVFSLLLYPFFIIFLPKFYELISPFLLYLLILASLILIISDGILAGGIFLLAGVFGILALNLPLHNPLFFAFSGLFAVPSLLNFVERKQKKQFDVKLEYGKFASYSFLGTLMGFVSGILPAINGSSQIAILFSPLLKTRREEFLMITSSIGISQVLFSFLTLFSIGKARIGAAAVIGDLVPEFGIKELLNVLGISLLIMGISIVLIWLFIEKFSNFVQKRWMAYIVVIFLVGASYIMGGYLGLLVLATGSAIGMLPLYLNLRRSNLMAFLIMPTILNYL